MSREYGGPDGHWEVCPRCRGTMELRSIREIERDMPPRRCGCTDGRAWVKDADDIEDEEAPEDERTDGRS